MSTGVEGMEQIWGQIRELRGRPGALAVFGVGVAALWLLLVGVVGAIVVSDEGNADVATRDGDTSFLDDAGGGGAGFDAPDADGDGSTTTAPSTATAPDTPEAGAGGGEDPNATDGGAPQGDGAPAPTEPAGNPEGPSPSGGDSTGVTSSQIKVGVHAPITFSGVPLNLAEDPIKGLETYTKFLNDNGGINGRKIVLDIQDDRFDAPGARAAADRLINDNKNFMVSGTLGIDQVAIVAAEAAKRGVPYTAAGGNENKPILGMFQLSANYTTHVLQLADYISIDPNLKGKRIGILVSDSQFIRPVADQFKARLQERGQTVSTIVANEKPAQNPDYNGYLLEFARTNTEVLVPLTDPLTTQQIVQRCAAGAACGWTYSFSNFAHDSDTALTLMTPTWANQRVRGLSGACYYQAPEVNDRAKCASMSIARDQYIAARGQAAWDDEGSGAATGYQIVSFLKGALAAPGADLTRERFSDALRAYQGYSDLITGPITFAGSGNTMRGSTKMSVLEAQSDNRFKMITPGLVDGF